MTDKEPISAKRAIKGKGLPSPEDAIGRRIREKRDELLLNVSQLSERTKSVSPDGKGLSRAVIAGYENGDYKPGTRELRILCDTLGVSPNWLIYGNKSVSAHKAIVRRGLAEDAELEAAKLLYIMYSLPEVEFDAVVTLLLSLAQKDKALMTALSDDTNAMGLVISVGMTLGFTEKWGRYIDSENKKTDPKIKALVKKRLLEMKGKKTPLHNP